MKLLVPIKFIIVPSGLYRLHKRVLKYTVPLCEKNKNLKRCSSLGKFEVRGPSINKIKKYHKMILGGELQNRLIHGVSKQNEKTTPLVARIPLGFESS